MKIIEILLTLVNISAPLIAIKGLYIWRNQLRGTNEYKLSEQVLEKTYTLQDTIRTVRSPWVSNAELNQRESEIKMTETESQREKMIRNEAYALWKRTEPMFKAVSRLKIGMFKVKALWGESAINDINSFIKKAYELRNAQTVYFQMKINPSLLDEEIMDNYWKVIYEMPEDKDMFWKEIESIILNIEDRFRQYIR